MKTPTLSKVKPSPTPELTSEPDESKSVENSVLGTQASPSPTPEAVQDQPSMKPIIISLLFISMGLALAAGVLVWKKRLELSNKTHDILEQ